MQSLSWSIVFCSDCEQPAAEDAVALAEEVETVLRSLFQLGDKVEAEDSQSVVHPGIQLPFVVKLTGCPHAQLIRIRRAAKLALRPVQKLDRVSEAEP